MSNGQESQIMIKNLSGKLRWFVRILTSSQMKSEYNNIKINKLKKEKVIKWRNKMSYSVSISMQKHMRGILLIHKKRLHFRKVLILLSFQP